jgi:hypothetical protein
MRTKKLEPLIERLKNKTGYKNLQQNLSLDARDEDTDGNNTNQSRAWQERQHARHGCSVAETLRRNHKNEI